MTMAGLQNAVAGEGAPGDLRIWLTQLARSDRLAVMRPGVNLTFELAAIASRLDGTRASLFPEPSGHAVPVVSGLVSNRAWMAEAIGVSESALVGRFQEAVSAPLASAEVKNAACQQVVHRNPDLAALLPIPTHNEHDFGPYITAGLLIVRNPVTGVQNVSIHRLQLSGRSRLGALLLPRHALAFFDHAESADVDLDVAVAIGVGPALLLASQAILPIDNDELEVAGALLGRPVPVVRCLNSEIRVPAEAEIVLEGRLLARAREPEGPFGEFPQYYGERADRHVIEVDAVTTRRAPVFHTIVGGGLEHLLLGAIPREATILANMQRNFPSVSAVHLPRGGTCRYHLYVKMRKRFEGEAKNVILGALAAHYDVKHVIVVDEDVDIYDPAQVEWALATRFQAERDLVIVNRSQGSKLDPSTQDGVGSKLGFDATVPLGTPEFRYKRIRVPGQEDVDLGACIDPNGRLEDHLHDD